MLLAQLRALGEVDPFFDEGMQGFIVNTTQREYWRVAGVCDLDDLLQEGLMCYHKCRQRYSQDENRDVTAPLTREWLQALVARAFMNRIYDLAAKKKHGFAVAASSIAASDESPEEFLERNLPAQESSTLGAVLAQAPWELLELLRLLAGDGGEALGFKRKGRSAGRETTNEFYCRILGVDPKERNLVEELRTHFG